MMTEVCEAEIELENCANIIDFTRVCYSIDRQEDMHILCHAEDDNSRVHLKHIRLSETFNAPRNKVVGSMALSQYVD